MALCRDGLIYHFCCAICEQPIVADGGRYEATRYIDTDYGPVCEECTHEWADRVFEENSQKDRLGFDEDIWYEH